MTGDQLHCLDQSCYGSHILLGQAPALGLTLLGNWYLQGDQWAPVQCQVGLRTQNPKAVAKVTHRSKLFANPGHSVMARSIGFSSYVIYHTSYHGFTPNDIRWLQQQAIRLVIGRHWVQQQHLSPIFRWLRIAPLTDPAVCLTVSVLGLYVRRGVTSAF